MLTNEQLDELRRSPLTAWNRVSKAIELSGLPRTEVARKTGLGYTFVTDLAACRYNTITVEKAHVVAEFFGCALEDLFPAKVA